MSLLIDTDVAMHLRDGVTSDALALAEWGEQPMICMPTLVELQAGLYADPELTGTRLQGMDRLLSRMPLLDLSSGVVEAYGRVLQSVGFSRTRVFDRLIAATAIVHDLTLITINGSDLRDLPGLKLEAWPSPAQ